MRLGIALLALTGCQLVFDVEPRLNAGVCPAEFGDQRYVLFEGNAMSWLGARDACRDLDTIDDDRFTHLAVIENLGESLQMPASADASVGLFREAVGSWRWVTSEFPSEDPTLWAPQRPDDNGGDCAARISTGELDNVSCGVERAYICECDSFDAE